MKIQKALMILSCVAMLSFPTASWSRNPPKDLLSKEQAEAAALKVYSGEVDKIKLKKKYRMWLYDVHIRGRGDLTVYHEVFVDAKTGEMVFHLIEKLKKKDLKKIAAGKPLQTSGTL